MKYLVLALAALLHTCSAQEIAACISVSAEDGFNGQVIDNDCDLVGITCGFNNVSMVFFNAEDQVLASNVSLTNIAPLLARVDAMTSGSIFTTTDANITYQEVSDDLTSPDWQLVADFTVDVADSDMEFNVSFDGVQVVNRGFALQADAPIFFVQDGTLPCGSIEPCAFGLTDPIDDPNRVLQLFVAERTEANRLLGSVCYEGVGPDATPVATFSPTPARTLEPTPIPVPVPTPLGTDAPTPTPTESTTEATAMPTPMTTANATEPPVPAPDLSSTELGVSGAVYFNKSLVSVVNTVIPLAVALIAYFT